MDNLKKIGLTALGTALVTAGSAQAASLSVSGATSIFFNGEDNSDPVSYTHLTLPTIYSV